MKLPVNEQASTNPKGIYEISNLTAEKIIKVYNDTHGIKSILLRLTNIYGPRAQMRHDRYCVANWFLRQAIDDSTIKVFGQGKILRDFLYVDDCVQAILMCACYEQACGEIFNVGSDKHASILELVKELIRVAGSGRWEFAPFSPERKAQEHADDEAGDDRKIEAAAIALDDDVAGQAAKRQLRQPWPRDANDDEANASGDEKALHGQRAV